MNEESLVQQESSKTQLVITILPQQDKRVNFDRKNISREIANWQVLFKLQKHFLQERSLHRYLVLFSALLYCWKTFAHRVQRFFSFWWKIWLNGTRGVLGHSAPDALAVGAHCERMGHRKTSLLTQTVKMLHILLDARLKTEITVESHQSFTDLLSYFLIPEVPKGCITSSVWVKSL